MKYSDAKNAADKLGSFVEMFSRLKTVLDAGVAFEQEEGALKSRLKAAEASAVEAETNAEAARAALQKSQEAVTAANAQAAEIVAGAKQTAANLIAAARVDCETARGAADADRAAAATVLLNAKNAEREIQGRISSATTELSDITQRIEQAKADARQRFGG